MMIYGSSDVIECVCDVYVSVCRDLVGLFEHVLKCHTVSHTKTRVSASRGSQRFASIAWHPKLCPVRMTSNS